MLARGASRLAATVGIPPLIVGLTVVAFGAGDLQWEASSLRPVVQRLLLTSGRRWPLIEFNRVSVRVFDEVGSINDASRRVARLRNALSHFATIRNDDDDGAEFGGARFNFAFANDNQRVSADIARHAEKIFDRGALCGNFGTDFQPKHTCIELPGSLEVADTNSETRNSNGLHVLWDGWNDGSYLLRQWRSAEEAAEHDSNG